MLAGALLAIVGTLLYTFEQSRPKREPAVVFPGAIRAFQALAFPPGPVQAITYETNQGLLWAWEWATQGPMGMPPPGPVASVRFLGGGEVAVDGNTLIRFRRPLRSEPGESMPPALVEDYLRRQLTPVIPELSSASVSRVASRWDSGAIWHRVHWVVPGKSLPRGWHEEVEAEVAGKTVVAVSRRLVPDVDHVGVVLGRTGELGRARWLAYFAGALGVLGLIVAAAEAFWFRLRLPWMKAFVLASCCWVLGVVSAHTLPVVAFWTVAGFFSVLVLGGLGVVRSGGARSCVFVGLVLAVGTFYWPEAVRVMGGWVPRTGVVLTEPWPQVAAEAAFRALGEEPFLRGGIPWVLQPYLGTWAAFAVAAAVGGFLHPVPAVPLPAGVIGEVLAQGVLAWLAARHGWSSAAVSRVVWELLRLGFFAPRFPWELTWWLLLLLALGSLLWFGKERSSLR